MERGFYPRTGREPRRGARALRGEPQRHLAPVAGRGRAAHHAELREAVDHADRAVVLDEEEGGQAAYRKGLAPDMGLHREEGLVLLLGDAEARRGRIAEREEAAQRVAERGEHLIVGG